MNGEVEDKCEKDAERIRSLRRQVGLTQEVLGDRAGLPQESISQIETGKQRPNGPTLRKIAKGLGVALSVLLGEEFEMAENRITNPLPVWIDKPLRTILEKGNDQLILSLRKAIEALAEIAELSEEVGAISREERSDSG